MATRRVSRRKWVFVFAMVISTLVITQGIAPYSMALQQSGDLHVSGTLTVGNALAVGTATVNPAATVQISSRRAQTVLFLENTAEGGLPWRLQASGPFGGKVGFFEILNDRFQPGPDDPQFFEGGAAITITPNHKVGIGGEPTGEAELHIWGGGHGTDLFLQNVNGLLWWLSSVGDIPERAGYFSLSSVNGGIRQEHMTIAPSGNVGLGIANPQARLHVAGDIRKTGIVSFVESHPDNAAKEIVYTALEGPEAGTYVRGTARLTNGEAVIDLPEHFGLVTNDEGLTVQLTSLGEWLRLYVVQKSTKQIIVREASGKSGYFDYLVQGVRQGYEGYQAIRDKP